MAETTTPQLASAPAPAVESPRAMDMSKVTSPILLHLLAPEMTFPLLFLLKCRMTVGGFKKTIGPQFPADLIQLAALPLWVYLNLKKKIGGARMAYEFDAARGRSIGSEIRLAGDVLGLTLAGRKSSPHARRRASRPGKPQELPGCGRSATTAWASTSPRPHRIRTLSSPKEYSPCKP